LCIDRNQNKVGQKLYPCELRTKSETGEWGRAGRRPVLVWGAAPHLRSHN